MIYLMVDSASDCSVKGKPGYEFVPIVVSIGGNEYRDGIDLDKDTFYDLLIHSEEFPKTSQPSPQVFAELFERVRDNGDELIYFALSSALSGTFQSAVIAKQMVDYDGIYLVDSLTASYGIKILLQNAEKMMAEGATAQEIAENSETLKSRIRIVAAVDTLEYLHRGGRLSRGAAAVATVAGIKPTITVSKEGAVSVLGKSLGKGKAMQHILKVLSGIERDEQYPVDTLFSYGEENCVELEKKLVEEGYSLGERLQIGSSIGAHIGPGAYGVLFVQK